jgi:pimeloyl-ACP methyl ester carboxylesterase
MTWRRFGRRAGGGPFPSIRRLGLFAWRGGRATTGAYSAGVVSKLILACTYACNVSTPRERLETGMLLTLLRFFSPGTIAKLILRASKPKPAGAIGLTTEQAAWVQSILAANRAPAMRGAVRGLITFDSRPWLNEITAPTLVVGGTHDFGVPQHHFDTLVHGIPGASGRLVDRAGHTLVWTHTCELAEIIRAQ